MVAQIIVIVLLIIKHIISIPPAETEGFKRVFVQKSDFQALTTFSSKLIMHQIFYELFFMPLLRNEVIDRMCSNDIR